MILVQKSVGNLNPLLLKYTLPLMKTIKSEMDI